MIYRRPPLPRRSKTPSMVRFGAMSVETRAAWTTLSAEREFVDLAPYQEWMPVEVAAHLFFWLREVGDTPARFPKGKWASIQFFEALVTEAVCTEMETTGRS